MSACGVAMSPPDLNAVIEVLLSAMSSGLKMFCSTNASHSTPVTAGMIWPAAITMLLL